MNKKINQIKGINFIGFINGKFGLGQAARLIISSLQKQDIPFTVLSADFMISDRSKEDCVIPAAKDFLYPINLFCIDHQYISDFVERYDWELFKNSYNIGICYWETNCFPKRASEWWKYLDELWVTTHYVKEHISNATSLPVHHIPQPVEVNYIPQIVKKEDCGLKSNFTFYYCFDFNSIVNRKNPMAIIQAFQQAFQQGQEVQLLIKSQNGKSHPNLLQSFLDKIKNDSRIVWMDEKMDSQKNFEIMNLSDCYISLHRSEGFGLSMAEAMLLGKPVIATAYSGNLDFMNDENSYLCSHRLIRIGHGNKPYPSKGLWADVNISQAAFWMQSVFNNPVEASSKAAKGKEFILKHHSCETVGQYINRRIQKITLPDGPKNKPKISFKSKLRKNLVPLNNFFRNLLRPYKRMIWAKIFPHK